MPKLKQGRVQWNLTVSAELRDAVVEWCEINYGTLIPVGRAIEDILYTVTCLDAADWQDAKRLRREVDSGNR